MSARTPTRLERAVIVAIEAVSVAGWIVFIVVTFGQVIARYVVGLPFPWAEELARFTLIWFSFLCAIELAILDEHIDIDVFVPTGLTGRVFEAVKQLAIGATGVGLIVGIWRLLPAVATSHLPATGIPVAYAYYAAMAAGWGFAIVSAVRLVACLLGRPVARVHKISD